MSLRERDVVILKKMIQYYGKFDVEILWNTISRKIPVLKVYCQECIELLA